MKITHQRTTIRRCERALRDAGVPRAFAKAVIARGFRGASNANDHRWDAEAEGLETVVSALKSAVAKLQTMTREIPHDERTISNRRPHRDQGSRR